ncbi:glycosyltransferase family 4 protein [Alteromonas sp. MTD1]|uniref:glycosyltransferase family 4 protein n=1 Tax=Alteromonas sp. MTD1 TaxID=3057962 RepID=UPI0036F19975
MKILLFSFYYKPDLCAGSFRMTALVEQLKNIPNVEIEIVTTMPNRYASFASEALCYENERNVTIHRIELPSHNSGMMDQIKSFYTYFKQAQKIIKNKDYELVFATSSRLFTAFLGAKVARQKKLPLYLDVRDIFVDTIKDVLSPKITWFVKPLLVLVERCTFAKADHINLVSEGFKPYFAARYPRPQYSYFTNGIDGEFLSDNRTYSFVEKTAEEPITVLYAGNIGEGQGLHTILPALAKLAGNRYKFKIIGDGGRKKNLEEAVVGLQNVSLHPPVSRADLVSEYLNADVLFLHLNDYPAFRKVLPSKLFEYAAMGKPILAGVQGYASQFIVQNLNNTQVFFPNDAHNGLKALSSLQLEHTDRKDFVIRFARQNIMNDMAKSIAQLKGL